MRSQKLILLLVTICYSFANSTLAQASADPKICDGNHFKHISSYSLGKQNDLTLTFGQMQSTTVVQKVVYKDEIFRTYTINPLKLTFTYQDVKQIAVPAAADRIKVTGGVLRIAYTFTWQKKQLSTSIEGTGKGVVKTDPISFIKSLDINADTKMLQWNFVSADPITITNSLTVSELNPYKAGDYDVINQMLNELKSGEPTVKNKLVTALNVNFSKVLLKVVHQNTDTWRQSQYITYSYSDYHGDFQVGYDNFFLSLNLTNGLDLLLSKSIRNDSKFECGEKVPTQAKSQKTYGGIQQYISNTLIKSTLRNAINKGFLDVVLTEEFWQSPGFQFFIGDVQEVVPSTRNLSTLEPITGSCRALDDKYFDLARKSDSTYLVSVNFTCDLKIFSKTKRLVGINIAVNYDVGIATNTNTIDFVIQAISGTPTFFQQQDYPIKKMELAEFMVAQTLNMAKGSKVFGSGFKVMSRKSPGRLIFDKYLFLFDTSARGVQLSDL